MAGGIAKFVQFRRFPGSKRAFGYVASVISDTMTDGDRLIRKRHGKGRLDAAVLVAVLRIRR